MRRRVGATRGRGTGDERTRVVTERGRGPCGDSRSALEVADRAHLSHRTDGRIVDRDHVAVVHDLGMVQALLARDPHLEGDVGTAFESREPVREVVLPERLEQQVLPCLGVLGRVEHRQPVKARVVELLRDACDLAECSTLVREERRGLEHAPVACHREDAVPARSRRRPRVRARRLALLRRELHDRADEVLERIETADQGGVDALTTSGALADEERAHDAGHRLCRRAEARPRHRVHHRPGAMTPAAARPQPRLRRDERVVSLERGVRAGAAEPRDRTVHERRIRRPERVGPDSPAIRRAGREALDHHVGDGRELAHLLLAHGRAEVGDEALLAAVPHEEAARVDASECVAVGWLHLHDARAGVGEDDAGHRGRDTAGSHLDDVQSVADRHRGPPCRPRHLIRLGCTLYSLGAPTVRRSR